MNEGLDLFNHMVSKFHTKPTMEHYHCVFNLLSCSSNFDEAFRLMLTMPCKSDADILESLLAACRDCHEIDFQLFVQTFIKSEPDNPGN